MSRMPPMTTGSCFCKCEIARPSAREALHVLAGPPRKTPASGGAAHALERGERGAQVALGVAGIARMLRTEGRSGGFPAILGRVEGPRSEGRGLLWGRLNGLLR